MCFSTPTPTTPKPQAPLPQKDAEADRRAALRKQNEAFAASSGRASNDLGVEERMGDYVPASTRSGSIMQG